MLWRQAQATLVAGFGFAATVRRVAAWEGTHLTQGPNIGNAAEAIGVWTPEPPPEAARPRELKYRPEIDGLRAVAVIPVILYHAGYGAFRGGFVGVDVFFVISGYLITTILIDDLKGQEFSILSFYERRVRRILPALFTVVLVSVLAAWFICVPHDMNDFLSSLIGVTTFSSNIFFWRTSGYFANATEFKPLIHTWSLAVEEQFYLFFPIILFLIWRTSNRSVPILIGIIAVSSLLLAQWCSARYPEAAFYLLPTRAWELMIGALVAVLADRFVGSRWVEELGGAVGLALICGSVFVFSSRTPFPSVFTLAPTLGAAAVIAFSSRSTFAGRLLSARALVFLGLISYSAYLWHQPILAFLRLYLFVQPNGLLATSAVGASLALAYLTWRYVERPFRMKHRVSRRTLFGSAALCTAALLAIGVAGLTTDGFGIRFGDEQREFLASFDNYANTKKFSEMMRTQCDFYDIESYNRNLPTRIPVKQIAPECYEKSPDKEKTVLLWGDSHARHLYPGLSQNLPPAWQVLQVTSSGCSPDIAESDSEVDYCQRSNWFALRQIRAQKPNVVVVAQGVGHKFDQMMKLLNELKTDGVDKVVFVGPTPHWGYDLPIIAAYRLLKDRPRKTTIGLDRNYLDADQRLKQAFSKIDQAVYVSLINSLCDQSGCTVYLGDDMKEGLTSWDYGHLTPVASRAVAQSVLVPRIISD